MVSDDRPPERATPGSEEKSSSPEESGVTHFPGHVGCNTFWCARAMEIEEDQPDPYDGWFA
jgi:hypothetical protein